MAGCQATWHKSRWELLGSCSTSCPCNMWDALHRACGLLCWSTWPWGKGAEWASAPGPAPKGTAWIWQVCEVCLWKTAFKSQLHYDSPVPYHAHEVGSYASHTLLWASSVGLCQVHAEQLLLPLPPLQEGKEALTEKSPSFPMSLPPSLPLSLSI